MIKKLKDFILSYIRTVYLYEAYKNRKKISFKNYKLKIFKNFHLIKNKDLKKRLNSDKKKRFKEKQKLIVLYYKHNIVTTGWMYQGIKWQITEINREIDIKNKVLLYDFFTFKNFRNKGCYTKILKLIRNFNTKKKFWIYCLSNNYSSKQGIENSNFYLLRELER